MQDGRLEERPKSDVPTLLRGPAAQLGQRVSSQWPGVAALGACKRKGGKKASDHSPPRARPFRLTHGACAHLQDRRLAR